MEVNLEIVVTRGNISIKGNLESSMFFNIISELIQRFDLKKLADKLENYKFDETSNYHWKMQFEKQEHEISMTFNPPIENSDNLPFIYTILLIYENTPR